MKNGIGSNVYTNLLLSQRSWLIGIFKGLNSSMPFRSQFLLSVVCFVASISILQTGLSPCLTASSSQLSGDFPIVTLFSASEPPCLGSKFLHSFSRSDRLIVVEPANPQSIFKLRNTYVGLLI